MAERPSEIMSKAMPGRQTADHFERRAGEERAQPAMRLAPSPSTIWLARS
jgi:hypothetical protein